ncbi:MAG TPA: hypothetical protein VGE09_06510 [Pseudoxanthomonas sp.]
MRKKKLDPHTDDPRDPLELMARLLVGGSYKVPVEGRSTRPVLGSADIAGAVGYMADGLEKNTALVVATRGSRRQVAAVSRMAYRHIARAVKGLRPVPLDLSKPADRWKLRIVVFDATYELVYPERRRKWQELAKDAKMRRTSYVAVHKAATSVLQAALNAGRTDFRRRLFQG